MSAAPFFEFDRINVSPKLLLEKRLLVDARLAESDFATGEALKADRQDFLHDLFDFYFNQHLMDSAHNTLVILLAAAKAGHLSTLALDDVASASSRFFPIEEIQELRSEMLSLADSEIK